MDDLVDAFRGLDDDLEKRFNAHPAGEDKARLHNEVRDECRLLAYTLKKRMPPSREASLALTKLEEAMFWANAAIARNEIVN
jgi:hypothetical protein